jgi:hypothetical protein
MAIVVQNSSSSNTQQSASPKKEELLINQHSNKRDEFLSENFSPITPVATFDDNPDSQFQEFVNPSQITLPTPKPPRHTFHATTHIVLNAKTERNHLGGSRSKHNSKTKSINSSNHTEREFINMLSQQQNKKKNKKLELPEKYAKIYDELLKDNLEVLDLGGASLG